MLKYMIMVLLLGIATAAPAAEPIPSPQAAPTLVAAGHVALVTQSEQHPAPVVAASVATVPVALADTGSDVVAEAGANSGGVAGGISALALTPTAKQLFLTELPLTKTPASTAKLTPLAAPLISPISPLAYAPTILAPYPAWSGLAALPASYSIEQHGYHIAY